MIFNYTKTNTTDELYFGIINLFVGSMLLVYTIIHHVKCNANRKQLESELSKQYDERDDLIDGKASLFTMNTLMIVILLMMFLLRWISIPTDTTLFIIIIFCMITNGLAKKYYNHFL
ncbi:DUF2178 domain-containing protein [Clostridium sp. FP2]|uniref:DUF2178 domain-containing protein n=2 Tax=Clostridium TaxID=1485 RepID=UPI00191D6997|nr:DUF2178 domain-containing protein [Clostridium sp. FP2]MBZ9621776.1 DUF2178 domain-containing protein [Clostridium sp. FP2]